MWHRSSGCEENKEELQKEAFVTVVVVVVVVIGVVVLAYINLTSLRNPEKLIGYPCSSMIPVILRNARSDLSPFAIALPLHAAPSNLARVLFSVLLKKMLLKNWFCLGVPGSVAGDVVVVVGGDGVVEGVGCGGGKRDRNGDVVNGGVDIAFGRDNGRDNGCIF
ncbi:Hypothetical predicted protein [Octopus vulgaris]|uniref:Uncharacterized protein n=1 Tax=Octopus vulgaris TaxID=6645 RepID=A0AA36EYU7_OCTVU|nr:Hypothetical predicted protein [Octopus vulgaris]